MKDPSLNNAPLPAVARVAELLLRAHNFGYLVTGPDLVVQQASPTCGDLLPGADRQQPLGKPLTELLFELVGQERVLQDILAGRLPEFWLEQINWERADGSTRYMRFQVAPYMPADPSAGLIIIIEDTTRLDMAEQALVQDRNELRLLQHTLSQTNEQLRKTNQFKSLFLSMAAHDMRAPLTVIQGYAELMSGDEDADLPDDHRDFLRIVSNQVDWLNQLIADVVDLDRIEQGKLILDLEECALTDIVAPSVEMHRLTAQQRGLTLKADYGDENIRLRLDAQRCRQIVNNLLSNAIKFCRRGDTIALSTRRENSSAVLIVADTGPGMTLEQAERAFEIYYRAEEVQRRGVQGAGLGLFIVKNLVEAHGGQVSVTSSPGAGARFEVRLPLST